MKPVLLGTLAVVFSAIVAGPAFGQSKFVPGYTDFPNVQRLQDETTPSIPGNGVYPDLQRLRSSLTPAERQQLDAVTTTAGTIDRQQRSTALSQVHQPGVTSGPAALPPEVMKSPNTVKASFVPGYSDFPNVLRYHSTLTPTERQQLDAAVAASSTVSSSGGSGVNWDDAGVGIGIAFAIAGGLVILAILGIRRDKATPAPA